MFSSLMVLWRLPDIFVVHWWPNSSLWLQPGQKFYVFVKLRRCKQLPWHIFLARSVADIILHQKAPQYDPELLFVIILSVLK